MTTTQRSMLPAPGPARGVVAPGFEPVAARFARHLERGEEIGASLAVYHRGECVVDVWGGLADEESGRAWERDTRIVMFSVTKAMAAMALHLLAARGQLDFDAPVAKYWPGFGQAGKERMTVRTLVNHQGGLAALDEAISLADCVTPSQAARVLDVLERQRPNWPPGEGQGYHATTYGLYVDELFRRIAGESVGTFLERELLGPLGSDVRIGTSAALDGKMATLKATSTPKRLAAMMRAAAEEPESPEGRIARDFLRPTSLARKALTRPTLGKEGVGEYNGIAVRRACLSWASGTASAQGVARAFLPFALGGEVDGRRYFEAETLDPIRRRQGWSWRDAVLQKPIGWSQGFMKEERHVFCPNAASFGHSGLGGALGWCDPTTGVTMGYVMNRLDWRIRSPRAMRLCQALWNCEPLLG